MKSAGNLSPRVSRPPGGGSPPSNVSVNDINASTSRIAAISTSPTMSVAASIRGSLPQQRAHRTLDDRDVLGIGDLAAHRVSHVVKDRLMERFPQIADAIIHIEPPPTEM